MAILVMVVGLRTFLPKNALVLIYVWNFSTDPSPPVYGTKSVHSVRWGWCPRPRRFGRFLLAPALGVSSTMFQTPPPPPPPLTGHFRPTIRCNLGFTYQSVCLSLYLSVSLPVSLPVYLSVRLSVCVYEYENAWLSVINGDTSATLLHKIKSEQ